MKGANQSAKSLYAGLNGVLILACLCAFFVLLISTSKVSALRLNISADGLNKMKWQHRILMTSVDDKDSISLHRTNTTLADNAAAIIERRLKVFLVYPDKIVEWQKGNVPKSLEAELRSRLNDFDTILIGLDGGSKAYYESLQLRKVFRDIDGMPMRRAELN